MRIYFLLALLFNFSILSAQKEKGIHIKLHIGNLKPGDQVMMVYWKHYLTSTINTYSYGDTVKATVDVNGWSALSLPNVSEPGYLSISSGNTQGTFTTNAMDIVSDWLSEPGDQVTIKIDSITRNPNQSGYVNYNMQFSGNGSAKYKYYELLDKGKEHWLTDVNWKKRLSNYPTVVASIIRELEYSDTVFIMREQLLNRYKNELSESAFEILHADNIGQHLISYRHYLFTSYLEDSIQPYLLNYQKSFATAKIENVPNEITAWSKYLPLGLLYQEYVIKSFAVDIKDPVRGYKVIKTELYNALKTKYTGALKEKILTLYLLTNSAIVNKQLEKDFQDAITTMTDPLYKRLLSEMWYTVHPGNIAADFTLPNQDGRLVSLKDFRGKVVMMDFWYTGCTNCAAYYQAQLSFVEEYYKDNAEVIFLTICIDEQKQRWLASLKTQQYTSPSAVNLYTNGEGVTHQIIKDYMVSGYPHPVLIDKQGRIFSTDNAILRPKEKLIEAIGRSLLQ